MMRKKKKDEENSSVEEHPYVKFRIHSIPSSYFPNMNKIVEFETSYGVVKSPIVCSNHWNRNVEVPVNISSSTSIVVRVFQVRKSVLVKRGSVLCMGKIELKELVEDVTHCRTITMETLKESKDNAKTIQLSLSVTPKNFGLGIAKEKPLYALFSPRFDFTPLLRIVLEYLRSDFIIRILSVLNHRVQEVTKRIPMDLSTCPFIDVERDTMVALLNHSRFTGIRLRISNSMVLKPSLLKWVNPNHLHTIHLKTGRERKYPPLMLISVIPILKHFVNLKNLMIHEETETRITSSSMKKGLDVSTIETPNLRTFRYFNNGLKARDDFVQYVVLFVDKLVRQSPSLYFVHLSSVYKLLPQTHEYLVQNCYSFFNEPSRFAEIIIPRNPTKLRLYSSGQFILSGLPWNMVFYPRGNSVKDVSCIYIYRTVPTHAVEAQARFCLRSVKRTLRKNTFTGNGWGFQKFAKFFRADEYRIGVQVTTFGITLNRDHQVKIQQLPKRLEAKTFTARSYFGESKKVVVQLRRDQCDLSYHHLCFLVHPFECCGLDWLAHIIQDTKTKTMRVFLYNQIPGYVIEGTFSVVVEGQVKTSVNTCLTYDKSHGWTDFQSRYARNETDNDIIEIWIRVKNIMTDEEYQAKQEQKHEAEKMIYEYSSTHNIGKTEMAEVSFLGRKGEDGMPQRKRVKRVSLCGLDWKVEFYPNGKTDRKFSSVFLYREGKGFCVRAVASMWMKIDDQIVQKNMSDGVFRGRGWGWNQFAPTLTPDRDLEKRTLKLNIQILDIYHEDDSEKYESKRKKQEDEIVEVVKTKHIGTMERKEVSVVTNGEECGIFSSNVFTVCGLPWRLVFYLNGAEKKTSLFVHKVLKSHVILATGDVEFEETKRLLENNIFEGTGWGWNRFSSFVKDKKIWKFNVSLTIKDVLNKDEFEEYKKKELQPNEIEVMKAREKVDVKEFIDINFSKKEIKKREDHVGGSKSLLYCYRKEFHLCNLKWLMCFRFNKKGRFSFFLFLKSKAIVCDARYLIHIKNLKLTRNSSLWRYRGNTGWGFDDTPLIADENYDVYNFRLEIEPKRVLTVQEDVKESKEVAKIARTMKDWDGVELVFHTQNESKMSAQSELFFICGIPFVCEFYPDGHHDKNTICLDLYKHIVDFDCSADYRLSFVEDPSLKVELEGEKSRHPCFLFQKKDITKYLESTEWKFKLEMKVNHLGEDIDEITVYL